MASRLDMFRLWPQFLGKTPEQSMHVFVRQLRAFLPNLDFG
jgi:hypothetical protein